MLDLTAVRDGLHAALKAEPIPGVASVSRGAIDGVPALPAVVVGMPQLDLSGGGLCPGGMTTLELPVAVVVARPGTNDQLAIDQLDSILAATVARLSELSGDTLGGSVNDFTPTRTRFGGFQIGGTTYPSHSIFLSIHAR